MKRVVVTGMGAFTPIGNSLDAYHQALKEGKSGCAPITLFDAEKFRTRFACEVKDFDAAAVIGRKESRRMDRFAQLAMAAADQAVADANLDLASMDLDRIGVIWGAGIGGLTTLQQNISDFATGNGTPRYSPFMIPKMIPDIAPGLISIKYGFRGPNYATVSACASSSHAMTTSLDLIRLGKVDMMITGGSEAAISETGMGGFNAMKALSERNDDPATASRPFDANRDGFILGEGAGALVFEEYEHALARGAKIYAEVIGGAATADAHHITAPHPEGLGARNVMKNAVADAKINLEEIDYINVHGTSTPLGDIAEIKAIKELFGEHAYNLNISSTKSMTGHLLGAAGAIEGIACILAIKHSFVPPTINHFTDDPNIDSKLNLTFNKPQFKPVNIAISNTFGFGGHNASIIFRKI